MTDVERERIAAAIEANLRQFGRHTMAGRADLQVLADYVREGYYTDA